MSQPPTDLTVHARAVAAPGLLARLAAILNSHPVSAFDFAQAPDGTATVVVRLTADDDGRAAWHLARITARLDRVVGVLSVSHGDVCPPGEAPA